MDLSLPALVKNTLKNTVFLTKNKSSKKVSKTTFIDQKRFKNAPKRIFFTNLTHFHHPIDIFGDLPDDHFLTIFPIKIHQWKPSSCGERKFSEIISCSFWYQKKKPSDYLNIEFPALSHEFTLIKGPTPGGPTKNAKAESQHIKNGHFLVKNDPSRKVSKTIFIYQKRFKNTSKHTFHTNMTHFHHPFDIFGDLPDDHFPIKIQKFRKKPEKKNMFKNDRKTPKKSNSAKKKQRFRWIFLFWVIFDEVKWFLSKFSWLSSFFPFFRSASWGCHRVTPWSKDRGLFVPVNRSLRSLL